jgi:tetratricopeptide (TPR) repeat protein
MSHSAASPSGPPAVTPLATGEARPARRRLPFALRLSVASTVVAAAIVGATALTGRNGTGTPGGSAEAQPVTAALETGQLQGQLSSRDQAAFWQARVDANPGDYLSRAQLAAALLRLAREQGDPAAFVEAGSAAEAALAVNPDHQPARVTLAAARFALHDFTGARDLAQTALAADPGRADAAAVLADAQLELGQVAAADSAYAELAASAPGPAVTARRARVAFIEGRSRDAVDTAAEAQRQASRAGLSAAAEAWYPTQTARYARLAGDLDRAAAEIAAARALGPADPVVLAEAARVAIARGEAETGADLLAQATSIRPEPGDLALLADLQRSLGRAADADRSDATVAFIADLGRRAGQVYDRQYALFLADRGLEPDRALAIAEAGLAQRRDIYGYDAHAWAAFKAGRLAEAQRSADAALALGTRDPLLQFHAGMIAAAAGETDRARTLLGAALESSPTFDPRHAPAARAALENLEASR